jgi:hypothetical protein
MGCGVRWRRGGDNVLLFGPERRGLEMVGFSDIVGCHGREL